MKTWTVVVEIKDANEYTKHEIDNIVSSRLGGFFHSFQIFETTDAPYGPQGVYLAEHKPGRAGRIQTAPVICVCNPKSEYISRNCNATEHKTAKTFNNTCSKTCRPLGGVK